MDRVLVGVDGSPQSREALEWSADLAGRAAFEMVAARVFDPTSAEPSPDDAEELHAQQRHELEQWCSSLAHAVAPTHTSLVDGSPPDALLTAAREQHADMLVIGGRGSGGFIHLHLGSVAHHLIHTTTLPLAVVPREGAAPIEHLVVGVDGSPGSIAAADVAARLAANLGVPVSVVYAFEATAHRASPTDPRDQRHHAEDDAREWAAAIDKTDVPVDVVVDRDVHPVAAIGRALESHRGSIAIVGTRGAGGFLGLRLGRVPLQLLHHTGTAVIAVPPPATD